ncbi:hypothetical protein [Streptomyces sp.]|nr:hypothetical protein [Streptomyces sp.]
MTSAWRVAALTFRPGGNTVQQAAMTPIVAGVVIVVAGMPSG